MSNWLDLTRSCVLALAEKNGKDHLSPGSNLDQTQESLGVAAVLLICESGMWWQVEWLPSPSKCLNPNAQNL